MKRHFVYLLFGGLFAGCGDDVNTSNSAGTAGAAGTAGTSGASGSSGSSGASGSSGSSGAAGSAGSAGASGASGSSGSAGAAGSSGTAGAAGSNTGGSGGTAGSSTGGTGGAPDCVLDGMVMAPEQCDDGNAIDGDGCDQDCTFSCVDPDADCAMPPACQQNACLANHTCGLAPDPAQQGMMCGVNALCKNGVCAPILCGDGMLEGGEQCDFGAGNGPNAGCEMDCTFSCTKMPDSCPDNETCDGVEVCTTVMNGGNAGQKCMAGVQLLDCSACAAGVCGSGVCKASTCGDGCVDALKGEQCEPPGTPMCDAACKTVIPVVCGNGTREAGEQCDDANQVNLDGCDSTCKFEQDLRSHYLQMQFGLDAYCGNSNKLGAAIAAGPAQGQVQTDIDQGIAAGTSGFVVKMLDLASLNGTDDPMVQVGAMRALPVPGAGYNGSADLDWWYTVNPGSIDASRNPTDILPGSIMGNVLNAGPGYLSLPVNFFPSNAVVLRMATAKLQVTVGSSFAPTASAGGLPPGHLPSEHLDPALTSFATLGQTMVNLSGKLCGNVVASSFSQAPVPPEILPGGMFACTEGYAAVNSFLDVLINGCTVNIGFPIQVIIPSQPDKVDPMAPPVGAGGPFTLSLNAQKIVTGCTDQNGTSVNLGMCLNAAAYSSYFRFAMDRVILK